MQIVHHVEMSSSGRISNKSCVQQVAVPKATGYALSAPTILLFICSGAIQLLAKNDQVVVSRLLSVSTNCFIYSLIVSP